MLVTFLLLEFCKHPAPFYFYHTQEGLNWGQIAEGGKMGIGARDGDSRLLNLLSDFILLSDFTGVCSPVGGTSLRVLPPACFCSCAYTPLPCGEAPLHSTASQPEAEKGFSPPPFGVTGCFREGFLKVWLLNSCCPGTLCMLNGWSVWHLFRVPHFLFVLS